MKQHQSVVSLVNDPLTPDFIKNGQIVRAAAEMEAAADSSDNRYFTWERTGHSNPDKDERRTHFNICGGARDIIKKFLGRNGTGATS